MSPRRKLSDRAAARAAYAGANGARCVVWDALGGFGLRITPQGGKSFVLSYRHGGKKKLLSLGDVALYESVEAARAKARRLLVDLRERGIDPANAREQLSEAETVASLYKSWSAAVLDSSPENSRKSVRSLFKLHILPAVGTTNVTALDSGAVQRMHDKASAGGKVVANRAVDRLSALLNWAHKRYRSSFPDHWRNPCADVDRHREHARRHHLTTTQLRALWDALEAERSPYIRAFLRALILTGARKSEVLGMRWADVDLTAKRVLLRNTKAGGHQHLILPAAVAAEIESLPRTTSPHVFPGRDLSKPMSDARLRYKAALKRAGLPPETTLHDLRRSMGVALARSGYSAEAVSAVLRNTSNVAARHYVVIAADLVEQATDDAAQRILGR